MDKNKDKIIFRFLLILTLAAILAAAALIVFTFIAVDNLGLWQCLLIAVAMAAVIVLTALPSTADSEHTEDKTRSGFVAGGENVYFRRLCGKTGG